MKHLSALVSLLFLGFTVPAQNSFDAVLESYKKDKDLTHASFGFCVVEASTGKVIKEFNSELGLVPASTMKIVTTSAALGTLGKDYSYKTNFYCSTFHNPESNKDYTALLIKGSGDPSFNSSYF